MVLMNRLKDQERVDINLKLLIIGTILFIIASYYDSFIAYTICALIMFIGFMLIN